MVNDVSTTGCYSAIAGGHAHLGSINFERLLCGSQFEKLTEFNVPEGGFHAHPYYYAYAGRRNWEGCNESISYEKQERSPNFNNTDRCVRIITVRPRKNAACILIDKCNYCSYSKA